MRATIPRRPLAFLTGLALLLTSVAALSPGATADPVCATTLFTDDFDTENGGNGALGYAGWTQWTVSDGSVDLIGATLFDLHPGHGHYVDLDGSTDDAGVFTSAGVPLPTGEVLLSFELGGSARGSSEEVTVSLGTLYNEVFTVASTDPLAIVTRTIVVPADATESIVVANTGGDNIGAILDDVTLCTIEAPPLVCPHGHGYWKKAEHWPAGVDGMTLGGHEYTQSQLIGLLKTSVGSGKKADASLILAYQLIAANLSVADGADATVVQSEIDNATLILQSLGRLPTATHPSTATGQKMVQNASKLDQWVSGLLTEGCHTDVELTKEGPTTAMNDTTVEFTLNVTNLAHVPAKGVVVTDTLPAGWAYVSSTGPCAESSGVVTCQLGEIAALGWVEFTISATAIGCGEATNTAVVTSTSEPAGHADNNTDSADVTVTDCDEPIAG